MLCGERHSIHAYGAFAEVVNFIAEARECRQACLSLAYGKIARVWQILSSRLTPRGGYDKQGA